MSRATFCLMFVLLGVSIALAQLPTGSILGHAEDSSGAVVAGAKITVHNVDTGLTRTAVTADEGSYRMDALPVGHYEISAEKTGFKTQIQTGLTLTVGQQIVANVALQVGATSQTVSVTAEVPLVNTTTSSLGGLVDEQRVVDLPLNGRNYNDLTLLQPGVTQALYVTQTTLGLTGTDYSSNGAPFRSNTYLLDGAIMNNAVSANGGSAIGTTLGVDGIEEYRVITNSFSAEYGLTMGSQMTIVSRGGTNQFHGDVFEFLRNSVLDARNFFDLPPSTIGHRLPEFQRNNFGVALGGPIKKDKLFFFGVYEGLSQNLGTTNRENVLAAGCHGAAGAVITPTACPQVGASSVTIATQMAPLVALYPLPNIGTTQFGFGFTQPTSEHYGQMRVDETISSSDSFFSRYTVDQAAQTSPYNFPQSTVTIEGRNQFFSLSENHIFSPSVLNTARFSFSRTNDSAVNPFTVTGPQYSFVPGQLIGETDISGLNSIGTSSNYPRILKQNIFTWSDDLVYTRARHSLKFGLMVNHFQDYFLLGGQNKGRAGFAGVSQFLTGTMQTYQEVLAGTIANPDGSAVIDRTYHYDTMGFYAQDDWKVLSRLTLNLGLRYEPATTWVETKGLSASIRNYLTDTGATIGPPFKNPSLKNWSPRVGFAWDVFGNGRTSIRGGYTLLYDVATLGSSVDSNASNGPPFSIAIAIANPGVLQIPMPFPSSSIIAANTSYHGPTYYIDQPQLVQRNLTVEQQLPGSILLSVSYAGSRGIHLLQYREGNPIIPSGIPVNGACVAAPAGTVINLASQIDGVATSCYLPTSVRRNPGLGSSQSVTPAAGDSWYNALQVVLNKRLSKGLQIQGAYTYSRLLDEGQGAQGADSNGTNKDSGIDPYHEKTDKGPADFDVTHNFHVNGIYHFPDFTSSTGLLSKVINGWWMSEIFTLQSGYPFNPFLGSNRSGSGSVLSATSASDRADIVPGRSNSNITHGVSTGCGTGATRGNGGTAIAAGTPLGTPTLWYDPCAFSIQPAGFLGTSGRNGLRGPGLNSLTYSLVKDTAARFLGEGGKIQFRVEIFNLLNHPNFQSPGSSGVTAYSGTTSPQNPTAAAGTITSTSITSRQIQFGLKILF